MSQPNPVGRVIVMVLFLSFNDLVAWWLKIGRGKSMVLILGGMMALGLVWFGIDMAVDWLGLRDVAPGWL